MPDDTGPGLLPEIGGWLERYRPVSVSASTWAGPLQSFVVGAVARLAPRGLASAARDARVLARLSVWCLGQGLPLDLEVVLDPDTVERFVSVGLSGDRSRGTYRATLRRIGPLLTDRAPWEPRPAAVAYRQVAVPYSPDELARLWRDAASQSTAARRRAARAFIALGAGAGLDGRWVTRVAATDVERCGGVVVVTVGDPAPRLIPVLAEFEADVEALAAEAGGGEFLLGGTSTARNRASFLARRFEASQGTPRLSPARLRSTWLVHHLGVGTRLPELAAAAGLAGVTVLSDLLAHVPAATDDDARAMLRGRPG